MWRSFVLLALVLGLLQGADQDNRSLAERTRLYLVELVRLDTSNPPGNETKAAEYLKQVADSYDIPNELLGTDPKRLSFVARLKGSGRAKPLLLFAHTDVAAADRAQSSADLSAAAIRGAYMYGRGTQDGKSMLAAEMAVMVEIKRRHMQLDRDLILVAAADETANSAGIQYLTQRHWAKIEAETAIEEGGGVVQTPDAKLLMQVETAEKVPLRVIVTAHGTPGDGVVPRPDNAIVHLAAALEKLAAAEQPVRMNSAIRRYFREMATLPAYHWLAPLVPRLDNAATAASAANQIWAKDPQLGAILRTTISPTMLKAGTKASLIPATAEAQLDVQRLPGETRDDILTRFRQIVHDPAVDVTAQGAPIPVFEPSPVNSMLFAAIEKAASILYPRAATVIPYMSLNSSAGTYLRARGVATYGVPLFRYEGVVNREHGPEEKIGLKDLDEGVELLWQIVLGAAGDN